MNRLSTKEIVLNGLLIAIVFVVTYITGFVKTPIPPGYLNIGDATIIIAAVLYGKNSALLAGGIGSCLSDILLGAVIYAPVTLIVKGAEGYLIGIIADKGEKLGKTESFRIAASIAGTLLMVAGYFVAEAFILSFVNKDLGLSAAIANIGPNLIQAGISVVVGYSLATSLSRTNVRRLAAR